MTSTPAVAAMLEDADFPLRPWQIAALADEYGADARLRAKIDQIPEREYTDAFDVVVAVTSTPTHLRARRPL